ncbi:hypothetical protein CEXT_608471 [Caerostris extrusa]|uniref:Uncharacterized protein n=1 Tax=Caerostris extrusa TaxID=172846 RepID=A0AAV4R6M8_CAEEX|nr:hypothetical protein CEXT_608471 [Caerostris extrusa]
MVLLMNHYMVSEMHRTLISEAAFTASPFRRPVRVANSSPTLCLRTHQNRVKFRNSQQNVDSSRPTPCFQTLGGRNFNVWGLK